MRDHFKAALYTPVATVLGMISLFVAADHFRVTFFLGFLFSLLAVALVMGCRMAWGALSVSCGATKYRRVISRLIYAFSLGICLAATIGYAEQKEAFPQYAYEKISRIDAIVREPSVIYARATRITLQVERIHLSDTILSAKGHLECFLFEQFDVNTKTSISAQVLLQDQEEPNRSLPRCMITEIVSHEGSASVAGRIAAFRGGIVKQVRAAFRRFPRSTVPLLHALFLGERASLHSTIAGRFRTAGLPHLLALSGMHLAIITVLGGIFLRLLLGIRGARIGIIVFVILYVWLIGNKPSLNRAAIMLIIWNIMLLFDRRTVAINILSYAFIILSISYPSIRTDLSFQLSFSALAGILTLGEPARQYMQRILPRLLAQPLALTIAAQIITLPLLIYHFGVWYPVGLMSSIAITPLITLFMWSALMLLPFYLVPIALFHAVIDNYMIILYAIVQQGVYWFSQFPAYRF